MKGKFIISLDFELHWGAVEKWDLKDMSQYFLNTRTSIPDVLRLFEENNINATWATVGFLFAKNKEQLLEFAPLQKPSYNKSKLNYYNHFDQIGDNENEDPYHYGYSLIEKIVKSQGQELATHTFAHYYCTEEGQNVEQFSADLVAAQNIAQHNFGVKLSALVFPRNQYNNEYLEQAAKNGIKVVRSNPDVWFWKNQKRKEVQLFRALDTLVPISKTLAFEENQVIRKNGITELPASRFFRPYVHREKVVQNLKLYRILNEMTHAAKNNLCYHLWWHPHNFGNNVQTNLMQLAIIIKHYRKLNEDFGFLSVTMESFKIQ
ncbi:polysaccharide deacetylase family protein [Marnyiella aurantia]|uniref:Polysaccharide deacetylase family protein n=1 Tax=Marnyiella aurantia TaxID=2758037 RepID=A0A7D7LQX1_9FLAO|nr:polysaccharide deacetylase family protein [Marnyiella aurantia]MBA5247440.1 polysaccharide deacetylase family protein [Marnyiella aurantia]QMS99196.1 polysaccharide deacetylase family protein [Marnyiella aurantia]